MPVALLLALLVALVVAAALLVPRALAAKDALEEAAPLAGQIKDQILAGDTAGATASSDRLRASAARARAETDAGVWRAFEWVPVLGPNLRAVRVVATSVDELATNAIAPAAGLSVEALKPVGGAIDVGGLSRIAELVGQAADTVDTVSAELGSVDTAPLLEPVADAVGRLDDSVSDLADVLRPARTVLSILPTALGAEGPRSYLLIFQNNAEIRTTGGNPAAIARVTAEDGRLQIAQQASSRDFINNRPEPIIPLNPETRALYGERVGTWMQDITFTPDFTESAGLMRAFWAESFGTPVDAVVSFDPVALSYLLEATGPIQLATGDVLTAENAVPLLLNEAYLRYPKNEAQDAFFASAASVIFSAVTSGDTDAEALLAGLGRAVDEGRLLYSSSDPAERAIVGASPVAGPLPADNADATVLGVFLNDLTVGKMDYFLDVELDATSTQCEAPADPRFTASARLHNRVDAAVRDSLPTTVRADAYGYHGAIHTDVLVYGPVGSRIESVEVDGEIVGIGDRFDGETRELTHLGRPVLQVPILLRMQGDATVTVVFAGGGDAAGPLGPFEARLTPTVWESPKTVNAPGCR